MSRLKIGVFGGGRGMDIADCFMNLDCDIVAICDFHEERLKEAVNRAPEGVAAYRDFDEFLNHGLDAVILANYFHEHAPYAIKCFEKGIHVFSECISNATMAEGVQLMKAFEKTDGVVYFLAENYPQMIFNREMQRVVKGGTLGKIMYAEGEYNHPGDPFDTSFKKRYNYFEKHWRNYTPKTYYITHSLGPCMCATGATPKTVTAAAIHLSDEHSNPLAIPTAAYCGDETCVIMTQNDDGSVFRVTGCASFGGHHNAYRICGTKGTIENIRGMGNKVMLRYNAWEMPEGAQEINFYDATWNDPDEELIEKSGHGGGDFITARMFLECIKEKKQPIHPFNIDGAIAMSSVAILGWRSILEGKTFNIPDFRKEEDCKLYENDTASPFYYDDGRTPNLQCCTDPDFAPTEEQLKLYNDCLK